MNGNLYPKNNKSLEIYRGDTIQLVFTNVPSINTGIVTVEFQTRKEPDSTLLIQKTVLSTDPGNDWANGIIAVNLTPGQTQLLPPDTLYRYDLRITRDGDVNADYFGNLYLVGDISGTGTIVTPIVVADIYANLAGTTANKGASLIGVLSSFWNGIFTPLTVENALQWLYNNTLKLISPFTAGRILKSGAASGDVEVSGITIDSSDNLDEVGNIDLKAGSLYYIDGTQLSTDEVLEGANLYYTSGRFDTAFGSKTTSDLTEGTNLYYLDSRVLDYLKTIMTTSGDLIYRNGSNIVRLGIGSTGQVLAVSGGLPAWTSNSAINNVPIGSVIGINNNYPNTPAVSSEFKKCDGSVISDGSSPYNNQRIPNLNGATVSSVTISSLDNTAKTITVSTNDVLAFNIGDTLTFTGATVSNAVVRAVNYGTGVITIGDVTLWSSGQFGLTTGTLTGATAVTSVGQPRFLRGTDSLGSDANQLQGHRHSPLGQPYFMVSNGNSTVTGGAPQYENTDIQLTTGNPVTDTVNGTPRTGAKTQPDFVNITYYMKIKSA